MALICGLLAFLNALRRDAVDCIRNSLLITHHVESWQALQVTGDVDHQNFKALTARYPMTLEPMVAVLALMNSKV